MNIAQALKEKNRLAGELARVKVIFARENSKRDDHPFNFNRGDLFQNVLDLIDKLASIKTAISYANAGKKMDCEGVYAQIYRMAELKSLIAYIQTVDVQQGEELVLVGRDQEKIVRKWSAYLNSADVEKKVKEWQMECNNLQDAIDSYNATHQI